MRILVTGAGGFLGGEIVRQALARGYGVRALARRPIQNPGSEAGRFEFFQADLGNDDSLDAAVSGIEGVVHCAAVTSSGRVDAEKSRRVNVQGTRRLLEAARRAGLGRWVQISSMSAHPGSTSVYGTTKLAADEVLRASTPSPEWTILRPSLIYGPGTQGLVVKTLGLARKLPVLPLIGSGQEKLRPVHVADVARGALECLRLDAVRGKTYILGGGDEVTLDAFMRRLLAGAGVSRPVLHLPVPVCMILAKVFSLAVKNPPITVDNVLGVREVQPTDHSAAIRDWGWNPMGLDEGLRRTFEA